MVHLTVRSIPHSSQRYPTVGDYTVDEMGGMHIVVSEMKNPHYEFLVAIHEVIELYLANHAGISEESIRLFDIDYEDKRPDGDVSEPGDSPEAPYQRQHAFATMVERLIAQELGVDWATYSAVVESL